MNEAQTRKDLIDPAIEAAGSESFCLDAAKNVLLEIPRSAVEFAPGKVGKVHGKPLAADYVLTFRGRRLVVIEAKRDEVDASLGFDQAIKYGRLLGMTAARSGVRALPAGSPAARSGVRALPFSAVAERRALPAGSPAARSGVRALPFSAVAERRALPANGQGGQSASPVAKKGG